MTIAMQAIYTQTVGAGGAAEIVFNNIPQGFTDLRLMASARGTTGSFPTLFVFFNGDASSTDSFTALSGTGTTASSNRQLNFPVISGGIISGLSQTTNTFGSSDLYIPNYTSANFKQIIVDAVSENNATASYQTLAAGLYRSTSAITSITLYASPLSIAQHSTFTLYGITKG